MKRLIFIFILLLIGYVSTSQVYQSMPQYGYGPVKRMDFDSSLTIPTTCGVPTLKTNLTKKAALAYDSCNKRLYYYDPKLMIWDTIKGGPGGGGSIDTTSLSNRINTKLSIVDTTNKWVNLLYRKPGKDSIFYRIGVTEYRIKDSVGATFTPNGRFGNDTATVVMAKVHNNSGSQLTNGEVVYLSPSATSSDVPSVKRANNKADSTSANTIGFVSGTIPNNDTGWVILTGKIEKLNTSAFSNGDIIYLDSIAGKFTKSKPKAPYHLVYLGAVVKSNAGNGAVFVHVINFPELDELHNVQINGSVNNNVLAYSDTQKLWKARNIYTIVDTTKLSARIDQRVKYSDTASMLSPYLRSNIAGATYLAKSDSAIYQTKFRSDTARTNLYNAINAKPNFNPTNLFIPVKTGAAFIDSYLENDTTYKYLGTVFNGTPQGLLIVNRYLGRDYYGLGSGSDFQPKWWKGVLVSNDSLNYQYPIVQIGDFDFDNPGHGVGLLVDDANLQIKTQSYSQNRGLFMDFSAQVYQYGGSEKELDIRTNQQKFTVKSANNKLLWVNSNAGTVSGEYDTAFISLTNNEFYDNDNAGNYVISVPGVYVITVGDGTFTIPPPEEFKGQQIVIVNSSEGSETIQEYNTTDIYKVAGGNVDYYSSYTLSPAHTIILHSNGINWYITSEQ